MQGYFEVSVANIDDMQFHKLLSIPDSNDSSLTLYTPTFTMIKYAHMQGDKAGICNGLP